MTDKPLISVIIPIHNEVRAIETTLAAILTQHDLPGPLEVLAVDGNSTDGTRQVIMALQTRYSGLRLIDNPQQTTSAALNRGIRQAQGDYILRVDARTIIAPDYIRRCVELLDSTGAANVGGRMQPVGHNIVSRTVALSTTSRFGMGDSKFHYDAREQWVDTVYMGAFRREVFEQAGLFDEELIRNQDYELNIRIRKSGGKILLSPALVSFYTPRDSIPALWRQYFQYGRWKVRTLQKHPDSLRWRQAVPPLFVGAVLGSAVIGLLWRCVRWLFICLTGSYLLANCVASTIAARRGGWSMLPLLPIVFATIHFAWGLGFWYGLLLTVVSTKRPH
ncbi:MAG: glycosyltransferase family 2 protein [Anaerolineae bacterium]|nr:glycosyltransferase family 2 protein [Anaerolineae bacterium]